MKHNLKPKYKWRDRENHFQHLNLVKKWNSLSMRRFREVDNFKRMFLANSDDSGQRWGESALKEGAGTTNPAKINMLNIKNTIKRGKK